jgi:hypothetical protein
MLAAAEMRLALAGVGWFYLCRLITPVVLLEHRDCDELLLVEFHISAGVGDLVYRVPAQPRLRRFAISNKDAFDCAAIKLAAILTWHCCDAPLLVGWGALCLLAAGARQRGGTTTQTTTVHKGQW